VDCGDYVIVTNSRKINVTGKKDEQLVYRKHTMFPGGLKETPYKAMKSRKPDEASSTYVRREIHADGFCRLFVMQWLACYLKTNYEIDD
jgi:ribosomal protein L13